MQGVNTVAVIQGERWQKIEARGAHLQRGRVKGLDSCALVRIVAIGGRGYLVASGQLRRRRREATVLLRIECVPDARIGEEQNAEIEPRFLSI